MRNELSFIQGCRKILCTSVFRAVVKGCNTMPLIRLSQLLAPVLCRQLGLLCS